MSIGEHSAWTSCAFLQWYFFSVLAFFRHESRKQLVKDSDVGVLRAVPFHVHEFIKHQGIFRLLICISVDPVIIYLVIR